MKDPVKNIQQRTQRYWYVDGISEIAAGAVFLIMGLFFLLIGLAETGSATGLILAIGQPLIILLGIWGAGRAVKFLKERITYPRTGYVLYSRKPVKRRAAALVLAAVISLLMTVFIAWLTENYGRNWVPAVAGVLLSLVMILLGYRFGLIRFYLLGAFTFILGMAMAFLPLETKFDTAIFFSVFGLAWMSSGGLTLWHYMRNTQLAPPEDLL